MTMIRKRQPWQIPEREATPEEVYLDRRRFLAGIGLIGAGLAGGLVGNAWAGTRGNRDSTAREASTAAKPALPGSVSARARGLYPAGRNPAFTLDRPLTDEAVAARYNNFYEFTITKDVYNYVDAFKPLPWTIEIAGMVEKKMTLDLDDLLKKLPLEERLYRHRCVEAWAMAV